MSARPKLGFIGLGAMGRPMALNLMKAGYAMTVYARRAQALEPLVAAGARTAANPAEVARAADVVFSLVTASADSEAVALGAEGLIEGARDGSVVIDMATISPLATRHIAQALAARGIEHIDAPVSGGPAGAQGATLSIMVGGNTYVDPVARIAPLSFATLGDVRATIGRWWDPNVKAPQRMECKV